MFHISFYILIATLSLMAILMVAVPLPQKDDRLRGYMFSRWMLALSYLALGVYCYFKGRMELEVFSPIFLFMSNLQACLLALSHINLIHPQRVTTRYVLWHFAPMAVCLLLYIVCRLVAPHIPLTSYEAVCANLREPEVIARLVWMAQYVALVFYFITVFVRESSRWHLLAEDFFADEQMISLRLIRASFGVAMTIGFTTFAISNNLRPYVAVGLNLQILVLYIVLGVLFLQYPKLFVRMRPVLYDQDVPSAPVNKRWDTIRRTIISSKLYLRSGITLEQVAREVGVSRTYLSNSINQHEGMNFNAFINRLRILEAQRLMREDKEGGLSMQKIAEQVGYTEQSNFARQFKHWSGKTPREWRMS